MNKETLLTTIRTIVIAFGAFLFGKNLFGSPIDATLWEQIVGIGLSVVGTVWGIFDKTAGIEKIQSTVRSVIVFIGGLLVASGRASDNDIESWSGAATALVTLLYSFLSKEKSTQLAKGEISISELKKSV